MNVDDCWNRADDVKSLECFQYGGPHAPCTLNINNDAGAGMSKDPSACKEDMFYLWDEPITQGKNNQWAAATWMSYATTWAPQLRAARARGMKITTPFLTGGNVVVQFHDFFASCPGCSDPKSPFYIHAVAFNAWVGGWAKQAEEEAWIRDIAAALKRNHGREVFLSNYGFIGGRTATQQANTINGQLFDPAFSVLSRVYYFAAKDYGGGTLKNDLSTVVESGPSRGQTILHVLRARCGVPQAIANVSESSSSLLI